MHTAEYRRSLDLRVLLSKQANVRELKYLTLWRLATERKYTLKRERLAYNVCKRGFSLTYCQCDVAFVYL